MRTASHGVTAFANLAVGFHCVLLPDARLGILVSLYLIGELFVNQRPSRANRWLSLIFAALVTSIGGGILALGFFIPSFAVPWTQWRLDADIVKATGGGLCAVGLLLSVAPVQLGLMVTTVTVLVVSLFAIGGRPPQKGDIEFRINGNSAVWASPYDLREMNTAPDERFSYHGEPGRSARQHCLDFSVTYTHDEDGWRVMPKPTGPPPHPEIIFLGCSFTYGIGVEDDASYAALLAKEAWPRCRVRNYSFSGWGTTHVCLVLEEALKQDKPACVIYAFTPAHLKRNSLRASWHGKYSGQRVPHFDVSGNFLGLIPAPQANLPDTPETDEHEIRVTRAVLLKMSEMCRAKSVPFVALQIQESEPKVTQRILDIPGMTVIDVSDVADEQFYNDGHFTAATNRAMAHALASDRRLAKITSLPELYQPDRWKGDVPPADAWRVRLGGERARETAKIVQDSRVPNQFRVESIHHVADMPKPTQITKRSIPLAAGQTYTLTFRAKADAQRMVKLFLERRLIPNTISGLWSTLTLVPTWRSYYFDFVSKNDTPRTSLVISLERSDVPFEIADLKIEASPASRPGEFRVRAYPNGSGHGARAIQRPDDPKVTRVDKISSFEHVPWHVQLTRANYTLRKGEKYRVDGLIRADAVRIWWT